MALIGCILEYKEGKVDFESYLERLEQWMAANTVADEKKVSVFLSLTGADAYRLLESLLLPDKPSTKSYAQSPKHSVTITSQSHLSLGEVSISEEKSTRE